MIKKLTSSKYLMIFCVLCYNTNTLAERYNKPLSVFKKKLPRSNTSMNIFTLDVQILWTGNVGINLL